MKSSRVLGVLPNLLAIQRQSGRVVLERRFLSGMDEYAKYWDGELLAIMEPAPESELQTNQDRTLAGDNVEVDPRELKFQLAVVDYRSKALKEQLARCTLALGGLQYRQVHLADWARSARVPLIYITEYTLQTRLQIIRANGGNPLRLARRVSWEVNQERLNRHAVKTADGIQCNGTPTFDAYRHLSPNPLLFFDGRMSPEQLVPEALLEARLAELPKRPTLRLVFAGRINKMKGVDQLVEVGRILTEMDVPYALDIYGGGVLAEEVRGTIEASGLGGQVHLKGHVPFAELMPKLQRDYDLFICCHPQGDPAMAYLEMLACGLPIIGYGNEALSGILARSNVGQTVPIHDNELLCRVVRDLVDNRQQIAEWSRTGLNFAKTHTFDRTFQRRIEHVEDVIRAHG